MHSISRWFRESPVIRIFAGFLLAALVLGAFGWLVTGPYKNFVAGFDSNIRYAMRQIQSPMWTSLLLTVTNLGSTLYLIIVGSVAGIAFLALRWFRSFFIFIIAMAGQAALHHGSKWLIARPRPSNLISYRTAESFSFPSGHAVAALCLYGMIAWIITRRIESPAVTASIWIFTIVLIFLIGASRVYIGIHYPTDVVAGFVGSLIWTAALMSIDRRPL
jgi:undecaprenyl-diphosphatase